LLKTIDSDSRGGGFRTAVLGDADPSALHHKVCYRMTTCILHDE